MSEPVNPTELGIEIPAMIDLPSEGEDEVLDFEPYEPPLFGRLTLIMFVSFSLSGIPFLFFGLIPAIENAWGPGEQIESIAGRIELLFWETCAGIAIGTLFFAIVFLFLEDWLEDIEWRRQTRKMTTPQLQYELIEQHGNSANVEGTKAELAERVMTLWSNERKERVEGWEAKRKEERRIKQEAEENEKLEEGGLQQINSRIDVSEPPLNETQMKSVEKKKITTICESCKCEFEWERLVLVNTVIGGGAGAVGGGALFSFLGPVWWAVGVPIGTVVGTISGFVGSFTPPTYCNGCKPEAPKGADDDN